VTAKRWLLLAECGSPRLRSALGGRRILALEALEARDLPSLGLAVTGAPDASPAVPAAAAPPADVQAAAPTGTASRTVETVNGLITLAGTVTQTSPTRGFTLRGATDTYLLSFTPSNPSGTVSWRISFFDGSGRELETYELRPGVSDLSVDLDSSGGRPVQAFQVLITARFPGSGGAWQEALHYVLDVRAVPSSMRPTTNPASGFDSLLALLPNQTLETGPMARDQSPATGSSHPDQSWAATASTGDAGPVFSSTGGPVAAKPLSMSWRPNREPSDPDADADATQGEGDALVDRGGQAESDVTTIDPASTALIPVEPARGLIDAPGGLALSAATGTEVIRSAAWRQAAASGSEDGLPVDPDLPSGQNLRRPMRGAADRFRTPLNRTSLLATSAALLVPNLAVLAWSRRDGFFRFRRGSKRATALKPKPE
jgi:hypothetical protein